MGKKVANCEVTPQAIWPIAKSLTKRGGPKAPSAIHGPLGPIFYPIEIANINKTTYKTSLQSITYVTVTIDDMGKRKSTPCWLLLMKTPLLISDHVTSRNKYNP
jgi:hypothetical protein